MSIGLLSPTSVSSRGARMLRIFGGLAVTLALVAMGLGAGLWLGSPAAAATPPLQVKTGGDSDFSTTPSALLDVSALVPGGSVSGSMEIRDDSDSVASSDFRDVLLLKMINNTYSEQCANVAGGCTGAGNALAAALVFELQVNDPHGTLILTRNLTSADLLADDGVVLASGLVSGNVITVQLTASLPNRTPDEDNPLQFGEFGFDLALGLTTEFREAGGPTPAEPDSSNPADGGSAGDIPEAPAVLGTDATVPRPGSGGAAQSGDGSDNGDVLVLGASEGTLSATGVPVRAMLTVGVAVLIIGLILLIAARRRSHTTASRSGGSV